MIAVLVVPVTFVAIPSSVSVAPGRNPVPVTRISEANVVGPLFGDTAVTVSAAEGGVTGGAGVGPEGGLSHPRVMAARARTVTKNRHGKKRLHMWIPPTPTLVTIPPPSSANSTTSPQA